MVAFEPSTKGERQKFPVLKTVSQEDALHGEPSTKGKAGVPSIKDSVTGGRYAWLPLSPVQRGKGRSSQY